MRTIIHSSLALIALTSSLIAGCATKTSSAAGANEAVNGATDSNDTESNAEALTTTFVGGSGSGTGVLSLNGSLDLTAGGGGIAAQTLGDTAKAFYIPAGCLTVTDDPAQSQASYVFADCTGPYGLVHITGTVTVGYSSSAANELSLTFSATALQINKATIDWSATADITQNGTSRTMVWSGSFTGTTGHGRAIKRTNNKTYTWQVGGSCLAVNGASDGTVTGNELKIDVINYSRCADACPASGSEVSITDVTTGDVYDLKYGDGDATYTGPGGSITFTPLCADL